MRQCLFSLALGLVILLLTGCGDTIVDPVACPAIVEPAIVVEVRNARTGAPEADSALGVLRDGDYVDTMRVTGVTSEGTPLSLQGALERAGTYDVQIEKEGFRPWTRENVTVESGECGPQTRRLTAELTSVGR
jgi:hypothetical protein